MSNIWELRCDLISISYSAQLLELYWCINEGKSMACTQWLTSESFHSTQAFHGRHRQSNWLWERRGPHYTGSLFKDETEEERRREREWGEDWEGWGMGEMPADFSVPWVRSQDSTLEINIYLAKLRSETHTHTVESLSLSLFVISLLN